MSSIWSGSAEHAAEKAPTSLTAGLKDAPSASRIEDMAGLGLLPVRGGREAPAAAWAGSYDLPNSGRSPALARMLLRQALAECPPETVEVAALLASELVTNALMHAETATLLEIQLAGAGVRVVVEDTSADLPTQLPGAMPDEDAGRGLRLVEALASSWGWDSTPTGKRVWFELA